MKFAQRRDGDLKKAEESGPDSAPCELKPAAKLAVDVYGVDNCKTSYALGLIRCLMLHEPSHSQGRHHVQVLDLEAVHRNHTQSSIKSAIHEGCHQWSQR
jgi:hypothetical protein